MRALILENMASTSVMGGHGFHDYNGAGHDHRIMTAFDFDGGVLAGSGTVC